MRVTSKELLRKYNVPAPRYTSYPTVPYWDDTPTEEQWLGMLDASIVKAKAEKTGAALYMHIPFCEKLCTFCGCNTRITKNHDVSKPYIDVLHGEWNLYREKLGLGSALDVAEIHMGGGTPTFLSVNELRLLLEPVLSQINVMPGAEFSLEVDPRVTTQEQLKVLRALGFSRISLGIQDFDPRVQGIVNRNQPYELVERVVNWARDLGYNSINFDLIYGLPLQTEASVRDTFAKVATLRPDRIAFYAYAHVPWIKPAHRRFTEDDLPSPELKRSLYEFGREFLESNSYEEVGMDHFALTTDSLWRATEEGTLHRNFMGYMPKHMSPLLGLGVSSISDSWTAFMQNEKTLEAYRARIAERRIPILRGHVLTPEDQSLRKHILNLMTRFHTEWDSNDDAASETLRGVPERLQELMQDGLVDLKNNRVDIKESGRPFIRNIGMAFDARLARKAPQTTLFSKSI